MNRRHFLVSTALSGLTLTGLGSLLAPRAKALSEQSCTLSDDPAKDPTCRELVRHKELIADLMETLSRKNLSPEEKDRLIALASCPFCGLPLQEKSASDLTG